MEHAPQTRKPFDRMTATERIRHNPEIIGKRCGWPDLDAVLALLGDHPCWLISYYPERQPAYTDHLGRHEPGIPPGNWAAHPTGYRFEDTGKPRWIAPRSPNSPC
ncbi:hypothetical protein GCM10010411_78230 [Actinomadura fulvescens]|uniref:Uncharacterized protein n=1 Tax=Actinomadura fulvescens TaxID=46160 RepID=A0ABN3QKS3_9ACTN